jgi:hypothetical protein
MPEKEWERELAAEGSVLNEDARVAFAQQLALAPDVAAKRALVARRFVPGSTEFLFYDAVCSLLSVQELVESGAHAAARELLEKHKPALDEAARLLQVAGCSRKFKRVQQRRLVLELELQHRLDGSPEGLAVRFSADRNGVGLWSDFLHAWWVLLLWELRWLARALPARSASALPIPSRSASTRLRRRNPTHLSSGEWTTEFVSEIESGRKLTESLAVIA